MAETRAISIYVTCPDDECATQIAHALLNQKMIACANILPGARAVYRWDGAIAEDVECVMLLKARAEDFTQIETAIKALHPYDVPCIIAWPIIDGSADYIEWLMAETAR